jgi:4-amino-4-deoxy-L-arabinose transferase-like glycosyltransferase
MTTLAPLPLVEGTAATTDAILLAAITATLLAGVALIQNPRSLAAALGLFTALTVAQLAKGPVGLIVPLAVVGALAARHGVPADARRIWIGLALAAAGSMAIFGGWLLLATNATSGRFLGEFIGREVVGRALASREGHGVPWYAVPFYYPAVLAIGFLPWSVFAPRAVTRVGDGWRARDPLTTVGVVGVIVPVALFTLTATKLPHYVLPAFPPMALLCAASVPSQGRFRHLVISTTSVVLVVAAIALPAVERRKPIPEVARVANAVCPAGCDVSLAGIDEPSLVFLLDRPRVSRLDTPESIAWWSRVPARGVLIARAKIWDSLPDDVRGAVHEVARVGGLDVVHGGELRLVVVSRGAR